MSDILYPSVDLSIPNLDIKFEPYSHEKENPELFSLFQKFREHEEKNATPVQLSGVWGRSGAGPAPTKGGVEVRGTILTPTFTPPSPSLVTSINYTYDNTHFGAWSPLYIKLYIYDSVTGVGGVANISGANTGTIGISGITISARCYVYFTLQVGNIQATLFNPPYISTDNAIVYYSY